MQHTTQDSNTYGLTASVVRVSGGGCPNIRPEYIDICMYPYVVENNAIVAAIVAAEEEKDIYDDESFLLQHGKRKRIPCNSDEE